MTNPILRDVPERFESDRLLIRTPLPGDGVELHAAITESREELRPWMPWAHPDETVEDVEANVRHSRVEYLARRDLRLHLYALDGGTLVGSSGLHRIDWTVPRFEIGYWIRTSMIWCDAANERSAAVAKQAGFAFEARLARNRRNPAGALIDSLCFARLR
ncbi:MAG: GNAT family N-acetyltransferase [Candidatus Limnocylindria bacterium]